MTEFMIPDQADRHELEGHMNRYRFAASYCKDKDVLDVACGSGYGSHLLSMAGVRSVVGIDRNERAIEMASRYERPMFLLMDAHELKFEDDFFDVVVSFETIEHVDDAETFFKEVLRVLKPDGTLIISAPNYAGNALVKWQARRWKWHKRVFTKSQLRLLVYSSFKGGEMYGQGRLWISFPGRGILNDLLGLGYDNKIVSVEGIGHEPRTLVFVGKGVKK